MTTCTLEVPLLRAAAWFGADPAPHGLATGMRSWAADPDRGFELAWGKPDVAFVEPLQRRRLSPLARACFHCASRVSPPGDVRVVFASRHGEAERTLTLLKDLAARAEISPTLFSMSVHNAVPGLWSILNGNRAPLCAVAAGPETFGWGLVEALAAFRAEPSAPVLYLYGDDLLPAFWADAVPEGLLHAAALLIGEPANRRLTLAREPAGEASPEPALPLSMACLRALQAGTETSWQGPGGGWHWNSN